MKKFYQHPHVEISEIYYSDVLTNSNPWTDEENHDFGGDDPYAWAQ